MKVKELIREKIRKWQSNIEAKCPESTSSRNYTKEEWNAIYEYNAYTRLLSFLDTLPDEPVSDDLEKAADDYIGEVVDTAGHPGWDWETRDIIEAYIAGAKRHRGQKPIDDKAFEEWIDDWWKHNKVNNPDSYDKGDEIQFDEQGFKNFCRGIRNMYTEK